MSAVPSHVAIIMDGNGRWAKKRGLPRTDGHSAAERAIHTAVEFCGETGIRYLTLYAFSTENWSRPRLEVAFLMRLLSRFIQNNIDELHRKQVKLRVTGRFQDLPRKQRADLTKAMEKTAENTGLVLVLALSYGGRAEILDAVMTLAGKVHDGAVSPGDITEDTIGSLLYNPDIPDPDLIIRTSGEQRLSNFLLWQSAYSELYFTPVLWPDFDREHFRAALDDFAGRGRRYGGLTN
jgi:undecaprenyl diphosphate synthase